MWGCPGSPSCIPAPCPQAAVAAPARLCLRAELPAALAGGTAGTRPKHRAAPALSFQPLPGGSGGRGIPLGSLQCQGSTSLPVPAWASWQHLCEPLVSPGGPLGGGTQPAAPGLRAARGVSRRPGLRWGGLTSSGESAHSHRPCPARGVYITHDVSVHI